MIHLSEQERNNFTELPPLVDPMLLSSARHIYQTYCQLQTKVAKRPLGIAINPKTRQGQLVFRRRAVLLPGERFVQIDQIETEAS